MSTDSLRSSLPTFYSSDGGVSAPLAVLAYAMVATVIAGFAAPAAGLAIFALGVLTALTLGFLEWRRSEGSDRLDQGEFAGGELRGEARYLSAPAELSTRAYLRNAQLRAVTARAEAEPSSTGAAAAIAPSAGMATPAPLSEADADGAATDATPPETSREPMAGDIERGKRSGSSKQAPKSSQIPETPTAA